MNLNIQLTSSETHFVKTKNHITSFYVITWYITSKTPCHDTSIHMNTDDVGPNKEIHPLVSEAWLMKSLFQKKTRLASPSFPAVKSILPFTTGFKCEPNKRKQGILTNCKACQPCCCGSTKHFYRRFQLQKFCSDSSEHFRGYPMLARRKNRKSTQAECQSNYPRQNIRTSEVPLREKAFLKHFYEGKFISFIH